MSTQPSTDSSVGAQVTLRVDSVIVGEDGSPASRAALQWASRHVTGDIHVVRALSPSLELLEAGFQFDAGTQIDHANEEVDRAIRDLSNIAGRICSHVIDDDAPNALIDLAHRYEADAILVGSGGRRHFEHLVGATTGRLLHVSDVPVIVVPQAWAEHSRVGDERGPSETVIAAAGDVHTDAQLVAWARSSTGATGSIRLVHAMSPTVLALAPSVDVAETFERLTLERLTTAIGDDGGSHASLAIGHPLPALQTASQDAALIIVGSHRSSRFAGFLTGSIAQHLPTVSECPVAIVPISDPRDDS